jgi:hypothetical protein
VAGGVAATDSRVQTGGEQIFEIKYFQPSNNLKFLRHIQGNTIIILGAVAKFRKAVISFVISVRLSVRMEQLDSYWTDFHEISYLRFCF